MRLVESIEVEPPDERPTWEFEGAVIDSYSDQSGKNESGDFEAVLELVKLRYHTNGLTDLQIIENIKLGGFPVSDSERSANLTEKRQLKESGIKDLDEDLRNMEGKFGLTANEIVTKHVGAFYRGNKIWVDKVIELKRIAKELCGVRQAVNDIDDAELLKRLVAALGPAEQKLFGYDKAQHV